MVACGSDLTTFDETCRQLRARCTATVWISPCAAETVVERRVSRTKLDVRTASSNTDHWYSAYHEKYNQNMKLELHARCTPCGGAVLILVYFDQPVLYTDEVRSTRIGYNSLPTLGLQLPSAATTAGMKNQRYRYTT